MLTPAHDETVLDARAHLDRLLRRGWIADAGYDQLPDVVRYLRALEHRVREGPHRTRPRPSPHRRASSSSSASTARVAARDATGEVRTMLEELRVSTFAQSVGAKGGVSEPKVRAALAAWPEIPTSVRASRRMRRSLHRRRQRGGPALVKRVPSGSTAHGAGAVPAVVVDELAERAAAHRPVVARPAGRAGSWRR